MRSLHRLDVPPLSKEEGREELVTHRMIARTSGKGDCYDNAVADSFFATREFDLLMKSDWHRRDEALRAIFGYIATSYNRKRLHSNLRYVSSARDESGKQNPRPSPTT